MKCKYFQLYSIELDEFVDPKKEEEKKDQI
jgi:hypothetical protein